MTIDKEVVYMHARVTCVFHQMRGVTVSTVASRFLIVICSHQVFQCKKHETDIYLYICFVLCLYICLAWISQMETWPNYF